MGNQDAILRQLLTLLQHLGVDHPFAGAIQKLNAGLDGFTTADGFRRQLHHVTIVDHQHGLRRHPHGLGGFAVLHQHAMFPMDRDEKPGAGEGKHQLLVFLGAMARHMDALVFAVDHRGPLHHESVDDVDHGNGVAGDGAGGKDDRVRGLELYMGMLGPGNPAQGSQVFSLAAGHEQQQLPIRHIPQLLHGEEEVVGTADVAQFPGLGDHVEHGASQKTHPAAVLEGQLQDHADPVNRAGKGGHQDAALRLGNVAIQVGEHCPLRRRKAGQLRIGGVAKQAQDPIFPVPGQAMQIKSLPIHGGVVKLEVPGEDNDAHRSGDGQGETIGDGVGIANELDAEVLPHLDHFSWSDCLGVGAITHPRLLHLVVQERQGQAGAVDDGNRKVSQVVGNAANVVFMPVGHDHAPDALLILAEVGGIRHDHVDPVHVVAGEGEAGIHQHQLVPVFKNTGVFSNLMEAAKGNDA